MKFLGIDLGTTHIKTVLFDDETNRIVSKHVLPTPVHNDRYGHVHFPDELWECVVTLIRKTVKDLDSPYEIKGISAAGVGEEIILMDGDGKAIAPAITWYDPRGQQEAEEFLQQEPEIFHGFIPDSSFSLFKLLWIKRNHPDDFQRCQRFTDVTGYVLGRLSNKYVMDWSHASRTGLFNLVDRVWNANVIEKAQLSLSIFPDLEPSGTILSAIDTHIAQELGISSNVAIISGGHDHLCAAYAAGIRKKGQIFISAGTSEAQLLITDKPNPFFHNKFEINQGCFIDNQHYYVMASQHSGHVFKQWRDFLYRDVPDEMLYADLKSVPIGSHGVLFRLAPDGRTEEISGLSYTYGRESVMRAIFEGLAIQSHSMTKILEQNFQNSCDELVVSGHPAQIDFWCELRSAVTAKKVVPIKEADNTGLGVAVLAREAFCGKSHDAVVEFGPSVEAGEQDRKEYFALAQRYEKSRKEGM